MPSSWSEARFSDLLQQELHHSDPNRNSILPKPFLFPAALCRAIHVSYRSSSSRGCAAVRAGAAVGRQVGPALLTALQCVLLSAQLCVLHHLPWDDSCSAPGQLSAHRTSGRTQRASMGELSRDVVLLAVAVYGMAIPFRTFLTASVFQM